VTVHFDDLTFSLPEGWTISAILNAPFEGKDKFRPNVILAVDRTRQGDTFATYVDRQLIDYARNLKKFSLRHRTTVEVGGVSGVQFLIGWLGTQGPVEQWITLLPRAGNEVRTITATALAKGGTDAMRATVETLLAELVIEGGEATPRAEGAEAQPGCADPG
jgi:hypothetical protein